jgi:hypothetical protein
MIGKNTLFYYYMIKRLKNLEKIDNELDKQFIEIYSRLMELYKDYPF